MASEVKRCVQCKKDFTIESEDFTFYERIQVPPPTWCPDCRQRRRYAWRNERTLYKRSCDLCKKNIISIYSQNKPFKVYCTECWWSDKWDSSSYGRDFDFSTSFFEQWQKLQLEVPRIALLNKNDNVNSEYTHHSGNSKNCYFCFSIFDAEDTLYSTNVYLGNKDCCDCYHIEQGNNLLYECVDTHKSYHCQYCLVIRDCNECLYCYDCRGCTNCFLSTNLRNKSYYIENIPYSKEGYFEKLKEYNLNSASGRKIIYDKFLENLKFKALHRFAFIEKSNDVSGNIIFNSKNTHYAFDATEVEDVKYGIVCVGVKNSMDSYHYGLGGSELIYETHAMVHSYNILFTHLSYDNSHLTYCDSCHSSENLFGCVGMKRNKYCILNKAYQPEEYKKLKEKIIAHMRETGEYGEFFPPQLSPFGYNETQGQVYMPFKTKEEAINSGWKWEDEATTGTFGKETLRPEAIPDTSDDVQDSILNEVLVCAECNRNYKIVPNELNFYRREKIPIPRFCPECRYRKRLVLRPPRKLWHRKCTCAAQKSANGVYNNSVQHFHNQNPCPNEFETSYAPDRPEIVYCEQCYNSEVV